MVWLTLNKVLASLLGSFFLFSSYLSKTVSQEVFYKIQGNLNSIPVITHIRQITKVQP